MWRMSLTRRLTLATPDGMIMFMQSTTERASTTELRRLGVQLAASGDLAKLRAKTRMTKNTMARLLGVSIGALSAYEKAERAVTAEVALRIGEWYWGATLALRDAVANGIPVHAMIPSAQAAQYLGTPMEEVEARCAAGSLRCESLGVMGYYVYADEIPAGSRSDGKASVTA